MPMHKGLRVGLACLLLVGITGGAGAQTPPEPGGDRIEIGGRFSVLDPAQAGFRTGLGPGSFLKELGGQGHSLVVTVASGTSGIGRDEIAALTGPDGGNRLVKLVMSFMIRAWAEHGRGLSGGRFETLEFRRESGKGFSIEPFFCACSHIRARDLGARVDGEPTLMRMVAYACVDMKDLTTAVNVAYSERGLEKDLSDSSFAEGERIARSLQRRP